MGIFKVLVIYVSLCYHDSGRKRDWCFICKFERLIQTGQETNSPLSPVGLLSHIQPIGREEDAHEFLRLVSDASFVLFGISVMDMLIMTVFMLYQKCR